MLFKMWKLLLELGDQTGLNAKFFEIFDENTLTDNSPLKKGY